jgi:hypothetical protein
VIVVQTIGELVECGDATRYSTDEHNNLCVWGGVKGDALLGVFAEGQWVSARLEDDGE